MKTFKVDDDISIEYDVKSLTIINQSGDFATYFVNKCPLSCERMNYIEFRIIDEYCTFNPNISFEAKVKISEKVIALLNSLHSELMNINSDTKLSHKSLNIVYNLIAFIEPRLSPLDKL